MVRTGSAVQFRSSAPDIFAISGVLSMDGRWSGGGLGKRGPNRVPAKRFRQAADERWKDARCLHDNRRFEGAIYLCGYVLECFLKFVLCELTNRHSMDLEEAKRRGHNLIELMDACGLGAALERNSDLRVAFARINNRWAPEMRYSGTACDERSSASFLRDTKDLRNWLQTRLRP